MLLLRNNNNITRANGEQKQTQADFAATNLTAFVFCFAICCWLSLSCSSSPSRSISLSSYSYWNFLICEALLLQFARHLLIYHNSIYSGLGTIKSVPVLHLFSGALIQFTLDTIASHTHSEMHKHTRTRKSQSSKRTRHHRSVAEVVLNRVSTYVWLYVFSV